MVLLYGVLGSLVGAVAGVILFGTLSYWARTILHAESGWQKAYSGVSGLGLIAELVTFGVFLGGVTGCGLVHAFGKYRQQAGWSLVILGVLGAAVSVGIGLDAVSAYGRRLALSIEGAAFVWSVLLIISGVLMLVRATSHKSN